MLLCCVCAIPFWSVPFSISAAGAHLQEDCGGMQEGLWWNAGRIVVECSEEDGTLTMSFCATLKQHLLSLGRCAECTSGVMGRPAAA